MLTALLIITAVLFGINALGVYVFKESSWTPELALDLQGGTQIILEAQTADGAAPTDEQMNQAVTIIRQRVDASGVGEADVTTEGGNNIVVQIPGQADEQTRQRIEASAQLQLRAVLFAGQPATSFVGEDGTETPYPTPDPTLNSTPTAEPTNGSDIAWITPPWTRSSSRTTATTPRTIRRTHPRTSPSSRARPTGA